MSNEPNHLAENAPSIAYLSALEGVNYWVELATRSPSYHCYSSDRRAGGPYGCRFAYPASRYGCGHRSHHTVPGFTRFHHSQMLKCSNQDVSKIRLPLTDQANARPETVEYYFRMHKRNLGFFARRKRNRFQFFKNCRKSASTVIRSHGAGLSLNMIFSNS